MRGNLIVDKLIEYRWNLISPSRSLYQAARARGCALSFALTFICCETAILRCYAICSYLPCRNLYRPL